MPIMDTSTKGKHMTLFEIDILTHYHTRATDYRDGDFSAEILPEVFDNLVSDNLLTCTGRIDGAVYKITDRGTAYIEALQAMPLPVAKWVMPESTGDAK